MAKTTTVKTTPSRGDQFRRDEDGLLTSIEHKFRDDGSVDWKGMIPVEYIVINEELVQKESGESEEDFSPENLKVDELEDYQKLILLGGIKEIAKIRGLVRRSTKVDFTSEMKAVVTTEVEFMPNYETNGFSLIYADTASATYDNAGGIGRYYLETIASNRSFVRAVRNALRIDIVGSDEINMTYSGGNFGNKEEEIMSNGNKPLDKLIERSKVKGFDTFESFKERLISVGGLKDIPLESINAWTDWKDIEPEFVWILLSKLNSAGTASKKS